MAVVASIFGLSFGACILFSLVILFYLEIGLRLLFTVYIKVNRILLRQLVQFIKYIQSVLSTVPAKAFQIYQKSHQVPDLKIPKLSSYKYYYVF